MEPSPIQESDGRSAPWRPWLPLLPVALLGALAWYAVARESPPAAREPATNLDRALEQVPTGFHGRERHLRAVAEAFGVSMQDVVAEAELARVDGTLCSIRPSVVEVVEGLPIANQARVRLSLTAACRAYVALRCQGKAPTEAGQLLELALLNLKNGEPDRFGMLAERVAEHTTPALLAAAAPAGSGAYVDRAGDEEVVRQTLDASVSMLSGLYREEPAGALGVLLVVEDEIRRAGITEDTITTALALCVPQPPRPARASLAAAGALYVHARAKGRSPSEAQRILALAVQDAPRADPFGLLADR